MLGPCVTLYLLHQVKFSYSQFTAIPVGAQSSGLTTLLAVLVLFSVILALSISVSVAIIILNFKKKKKVETIQDYSSTAIELLTRGHPEYIAPPHPQPHLPGQLGHEPKAMNPVTMCDQY